MTHLKLGIREILVVVVLMTCCAPGVYSQSPVTNHGALTVNGTYIEDQHGDVVCFAGNSLFWSNTNWGAEPFYNPSLVNWLKNDWNCSIVRASMGVGPESGGYFDDPIGNQERVETIVNAAIDEDIYVLIDWHSHDAHNQQNEAIAFFESMAELYGDYDNVIYEIYNEPLNVSWSDVIKPYCESVIAAIREIDPDNLIVVGTPNWSQDVDVASQDPISAYDNIVYTIHFYAGTHGQWLRDKVSIAINNGLALFCTEWGTVNANGDGAVNEIETEAWMEYFCEHKISHLNWHIHDKNEGSATLVNGANPFGGWSPSDLTESGSLVKSIVSEWADRNCTQDGTDPCEVLGCTDPSACNFNPFADCEDNLCEYSSCADCCGVPYGDGTSCSGTCGPCNDDLSCTGCTYSAATNYDSTATIDDGTCMFPDITSDNQDVYDEAFAAGVASVICPEVDACPMDLNNDNSIGTSDLLALLGVFGTECLEE